MCVHITSHFLDFGKGKYYENENQGESNILSIDLGISYRNSVGFKKGILQKPNMTIKLDLTHILHWKAY